MPLPDVKDIYRPVLEALRDGAPHNLAINDLINIAAKYFGLDDLSTHDKNIFKRTITRAKNDLITQKYMANPSNNTYIITAAGRNYLSQFEEKESPAIIPEVIELESELPQSHEDIQESEELSDESESESESESGEFEELPEEEMTEEFEEIADIPELEDFDEIPEEPEESEEEIESGETELEDKPELIHEETEHNDEHDDTKLEDESDLMQEESEQHDEPDVIHKESEHQDESDLVQEESEHHDDITLEDEPDVITEEAEHQDKHDDISLEDKSSLMQEESEQHNESDIMQEEIEQHDEPDLMQEESEQHDEPDVIHEESEHQDEHDVMHEETEQHDEPDDITLEDEPDVMQEESEHHDEPDDISLEGEPVEVTQPEEITEDESFSESKYPIPYEGSSDGEDIAQADELEPEHEPEPEPEIESESQEGNEISTMNDNQSIGIEDAIRIHNEDLAEKVLSGISNLSTEMFEVLVIDLLSKMGYRAFQNARYTSDEAGNNLIHGVIIDDKTASAIYIHARKSSPEKTIGRADMQDFIDALSDKGGKGIFATTANFSEQAEVLANDERIMLIDGLKLAGLMIAHNFCVKVEKVYEVKEFDTESFSDYQR